MIAELRGVFFLLLSLLFFVAIIGLLALSTVMRPDRWSERPRPAN
jgi:hypothetical protein